MLLSFKNHFLKESLILIILGIIDLFFTIYLIFTGLFTEGNPILSFYLQKSLILFILAKMYLTLVTVFILEIIKKQNAIFVRNVLRLGIVFYFMIYMFGFIALNF
jgi:hypothetical protein